MAQKTTFTLTAYLGTVSISPNDLWVVKKMLSSISEEEKTSKEWESVVKKRCAGIKFKK